MLNFMLTGLEIYSEWLALTNRVQMVMRGSGDNAAPLSPAGYRNASILHPVSQPCTQDLTAWRLSVTCQLARCLDHRREIFCKWEAGLTQPRAKIG